MPLHDAAHDAPPAPIVHGCNEAEAPQRGPGQPESAGIIVTTNDDLPHLDLWMLYHRAIGFTRFYLFVEGAAAEPATVAALRTRDGVRVFPRDEKLDAWQLHGKLRREKWLQDKFAQPCNEELFAKQTMNIETGIVQAMIDDVDWLAHFDTDELFHPAGTTNYTVQETVRGVGREVGSVVYYNHEALSEHDRVTEPLRECSLFKRNNKLFGEAYRGRYAAVQRGNPNFFTAYGNGKSIARVMPGLRSDGAHRWANTLGSREQVFAPRAAVLHYTYNRFSDLEKRRYRCNCRPELSDSKRCFLLPFDQQTFIASSLLSPPALRDFYRTRLVWDNATAVQELLDAGVFERIYTPMFYLNQLSLSRNAAGQGDANTPSSNRRPSSTFLDHLALPGDFGTMTSEDYFRTQPEYACIKAFEESYTRRHPAATAPVASEPMLSTDR